MFDASIMSVKKLFQKSDNRQLIDQVCKLEVSAMRSVLKKFKSEKKAGIIKIVVEEKCELLSQKISTCRFIGVCGKDGLVTEDKRIM